MASEPADDRTVSVELPQDLDEWLERRADALGVDRRDLLVELVSAYRFTAERTEDPAEAGNWLSRAVVRDVDERIRERFDAIRSHLDDDLDEIRRRVIQVKRATDEKADADHTHDGFEALEDDLNALADRIGTLEDQVEDIPADVGAEVGPEFAEDLEELEEKVTLVAQSVLSLRSELGGEVDEAGEAPEDPLTTIKRMAGRSGIQTARCGACDGTVRVGLLPEPACPHCRAELDGLREASGFFASPVLTGPTGEADDE